MKLRIFTEPQQGAGYDDLLAVAQDAERLGFDAFFRSDHYLKMGTVDGRPGPSDAWLSLAGIARETRRIRLGTLVSPVTFRLPAPMALMVAQVDAMSGGRVELGLGAGWFAEEHRAFGLPFPPLAERYDQLEEQLAVIDGLWRTTDGSRYEFRGTHYQLTDSPGLPKPAQFPRPPIILGGAGKRRSATLAARYADEYNVGFTAAAGTKPVLDRVRAAVADSGREADSMRYSVALRTAVGRDPRERARREATFGEDAQALRDASLFGSPEEILELLGGYAGIGVDTVYLQLMDLHDPEHLELIAEEVLREL